jgi:hypothetical protein
MSEDFKEPEDLGTFYVTASGKGEALEMDYFSFDAVPDAKPDAPYPSDLMYRVEMWMLEQGLSGEDTP